MEILQTIWNALTNENEILLNIISVPMIFIEVTMTFLLFTTILNISFSKKSALTYIICNSLLAIITSYFIPNPYNTFINLMFFPVLVYFILKTNALKSVIAEISFYIIIFCVGAPLVAIYTELFNSPSNILLNIPSYKITYSLILYAILFILYKILRRFNLHITFLDKFDTCSYNILIINFIVGILAIAIQAYTQYLYIDYIPNFLIALSLIILLIYFCISLYSLYRTSQLEKAKQLLAEEKMYNKTLNTLHDNIRGFKHDFHNMVQAIGGYISSNNMEGLRTYYNDLLGDCQINNNLAVLNPELINNPAVYSLLADKYYAAEGKRNKNKLRSFCRFKPFKYKNV